MLNGYVECFSFHFPGEFAWRQVMSWRRTLVYQQQSKFYLSNGLSNYRRLYQKSHSIVPLHIYVKLLKFASNGRN